MTEQTTIASRQLLGGKAHSAGEAGISASSPDLSAELANQAGDSREGTNGPSHGPR